MAKWDQAPAVESGDWRAIARSDPQIAAWYQELRSKHPGEPADIVQHMEQSMGHPRGYNYRTAIENGLRPGLDPESGELHWMGDLPSTGQILKGPQHPTLHKTLGGKGEWAKAPALPGYAARGTSPPFKGPSMGRAGLEGIPKGAAQLFALPADLLRYGTDFAFGIPQDAPRPETFGGAYTTGKLQEAGLYHPPVTPEARFTGRIGEEVGASMLPMGAALGAARAGYQGSRLFRPMFEYARRHPFGFAGAELGSAAASGAGGAIAQGVAPGSLPAEMGGQLIGGAFPYLGASALRGALRGPSPAGVRQSMGEFAAAGTTPTVGQASPMGLPKYMENTLEAMPGGASRLQRFKGAMGAPGEQAQQMRTSVTRLADALSMDRGPEVAGRRIEEGIEGFVTRSRGTEGQLWRQLDPVVGLDTQVSFPTTQGVLDDITEVGPVGQAFLNPIIARAAQAAGETGGQMTYAELRRLRSDIGRRLSNPQLLEDIPRGELKRLYGAITEDVRRAATINGGGAGQQIFNRANSYTNALHKRVGKVLQPLMRKKSHEQLYRAVRGNDASTIRTVKKSIKPEEWRVALSTMVEELGTARPSSQNLAMDVFDPETFLTNWAKLKPGVRQALWGHQFAGYESDLLKIGRVAEKIRASREPLFNPSGTGAKVLHGAAPYVAGVGVALGREGVLLGVLGLMGASNASARLFTSPKFVGWLAKTTELPVGRIPSAVGRLGAAMADEPESVRLAAEQYQEAVNEALEKLQ